jgi:hypothetical protein
VNESRRQSQFRISFFNFLDVAYLGVLRCPDLTRIMFVYSPLLLV